MAAPSSAELLGALAAARPGLRPGRPARGRPRAAAAATARAASRSSGVDGQQEPHAGAAARGAVRRVRAAADAAQVGGSQRPDHAVMAITDRHGAIASDVTVGTMPGPERPALVLEHPGEQLVVLQPQGLDGRDQGFQRERDGVAETNTATAAEPAPAAASPQPGGRLPDDRSRAPRGSARTRPAGRRTRRWSRAASPGRTVRPRPAATPARSRRPAQQADEGQDEPDRRACAAPSGDRPVPSASRPAGRPRPERRGTARRRPRRTAAYRANGQPPSRHRLIVPSSVGAGQQYRAHADAADQQRDRLLHRRQPQRPAPGRSGRSTRRRAARRAMLARPGAGDEQPVRAAVGPAAAAGPPERSRGEQQ